MYIRAAIQPTPSDAPPILKWVPTSNLAAVSIVFQMFSSASGVFVPLRELRVWNATMSPLLSFDALSIGMIHMYESGFGWQRLMADVIAF
jgi:hypothetical protein